jgi:hypothetical protein
LQHGSGSAFEYGESCVLASIAIGGEDRGGLTWRFAMALRIICMCGYVIQGETDEELWSKAQGHMGVLHPELVGNVTREDILAAAEQL